MKKTTLSLLLIVILQLVHSQELFIEVKVFLEGPFNGVDMNTDLKNQDLIPLDQPFNQSPWNYAGTESASSIQSDWVDWVLVELRETAGNASTAIASTVIARQACLVRAGGYLENVYGDWFPIFNLTVTENLYVVIHHRNHLSIMSSLPLSKSGDYYDYDFTDGLSKAYLGRQKEIAPEVFGMIAGDCDASGVIDMDDQNYCWELNAGEHGYESSDLNLDGEINNIDKDDYWSTNFGIGLHTCGELLIFDGRDGQQYETVEIGDQCWMAENLNIGTRIDGNVDQSENSPIEIIEKYCYDDMESNCDTYGGLYQWNELMQFGTTQGTQGICPTGWYIPTDNDWCTLTQFIDPTINCNDYASSGTDAGIKMKSTSGWASGGNGTDDFGFTALPSGYRRYNDGAFIFNGMQAHFWSSTQNNSNPDIAWFRKITNADDHIYRYNDDKDYGFQVRCIKNHSPTQPTNPVPEDASIDIGVDTVLTWACTDPEGYDLNYTLYFGTAPNPPLLAENLTEPTYNPILDYETNYYWKVVAFDILGDSAVSDIWSFTTEVDPFVNCGDNLVDARDAHSYNTVEIGTQCWMAENLNIGTMINGATSQTDNNIIEKYCYNNIEDSCDTYGGLYQWNEMMDYNIFFPGICPTGWHEPTDYEWCTLTQYIDANVNCEDWGETGVDAGTKMKSISGWASGGNGTDDFGFTGLPGGLRNWDSGDFIASDEKGYFWTSTQNDVSNAWFRRLNYDYNGIFQYNDSKDYGFSVRCLKNPPNNQAPLQLSDPVPADGSIDIDIHIDLSWTCTDPDGDDLYYDIYLGTNPDPQRVVAKLTDPTYNPDLGYDSTFYWKVVAFDSWGDSTVSDIWSFTTGTNPCSAPAFTYGGQTYTTVGIGDQCWMAENLNIGMMINGTSNQTDNNIIEKYCYDNDTNYCNQYGGLYQWNEMMDYSPLPKGICPPGWHIPIDNEWTTLTDFLGGLNVAGGKMKEVGFVHWDYHPDGGATNESGFTALPGGSIIDGNFFNLQNRAIYWSSTEDGSNAWTRAAWFDNATISEGTPSKSYGFSVRCLKNSPNNQAPLQPYNPVPENGGIDIGIDTVLSWTCTDPDGENLYYDLYFGADPNPPLLVENLTDTSFAIINSDFETTYYWKVVAFDIWEESAVSDVWSYTTIPSPCSGTPSITYNGQTYSTVGIGDQCWMAENLNIGMMINGTSNQTDNNIIEKYCYDNDTNYCNQYGGLYQWDEMMDFNIFHSGICPTGWHIPTDEEWCALTQFIDATVDCEGWGGTGVDVGIKMKSTNGWYNNGNGTDNFGFTGLPGGLRIWDNGHFNAIDYSGYFWTSTQNDVSTAWFRRLNYNYNGIYKSNYNKFYGFSVRCLKNPPNNQAPLQPSDPVPADGSVDFDMVTNLSWTCTDPNGDDLVYKVYLGFDVNPPVVAQNLTGTMYDPVLLFDTTYFWKVTAFDIWGDSTESNLWTFTTVEPDPFVSCGDLFPDYRDSHTYSTVQIGTQCWMADNLNIGTRIDGNVDQSENSPTEIIEKYCYEDLESNCYTYGGLYQWNELMDYSTTEGVKGICPTGWHIPTDDEWCTLTQFIDATVDCDYEGGTGLDVGTKIKSTSGWASPGNGTDDFGFTGLPGGLRHWDTGLFIASDEKGYFWTSTQNDVSTAWFRRLNYDYNGIFQYNDSKNYGFSVRCMKD